jgi:TonB family protein
MQKLNMFFCIVALTIVGVCSGVAQQPNQTTSADRAKAVEGFDVLSDTQGVNFKAYINSVRHKIHDTWIPLLPAEAQPPERHPGETSIHFTINPDGTIAAMRMDDSSDDNLLDRAAWDSIAGVGKFPPLPGKFHGPNLELRVHFNVNLQPQ